jgi:hypothetical protein
LLERLPGDGLDEAEADDEGESERKGYGPGIEREGAAWGHGVLLWREHEQRVQRHVCRDFKGVGTGLVATTGRDHEEERLCGFAESRHGGTQCIASRRGKC